MKGLMMYLVVMAGGGVAGAVGVGAYNVFVGGYEIEAAAVEGETEGGTEGTTEGTASEAGGQETVPPEDPQATEASEGGTEEQPTDPASDPVETPETQTTPPAPQEEEEVVDPEVEAQRQLNYQRLARIFVAMEPEEAAPVLSQLSDEELEGIFLAMQSRNAAPILALMDPARVAEISRKVLGGGG